MAGPLPVAVVSLRQRAKFLALKERGGRVQGLCVVLQHLCVDPEADGLCEVGYTASSYAVGNAVRRNRARRRLKAVVAEVLRGRLVKGHWWVALVARARVLEAPWEELMLEVQRGLVKAGVV